MGSIFEGIFGGDDSATQAADVQAQSIQQAIDEQRRQFDTTQERLTPFLEAGTAALQREQQLLGLLGPEQRQVALDQLVQSPGQKFLQDRAEQTLLRNAAAIGGLGGGRVREALQEQAIGFGQQDLGNELNRLASLRGGGQAVGVNLGQLGQSQTSNISNLLTQQGQARASGILGEQQANSALGGQLLPGILGGIGGSGLLGGGISGALGGSVGSGALLGLLSDERLKTDISSLDLKECYDAVMSMPLKAWRYIKEVGIDEKLHFGPMAQDAPDMIKVHGEMALSLHDELMMIAGALQYIHQNEGK